MTAPRSRTLPPRADLAQQKTQARELLRAFHRSEAEAVSRVRAALPDKATIVLADAQFVVAHEYGFTNWPAMKQHIADREAAARAPWRQLHDAMHGRDARTAARLLAAHAEFRPLINAPLFAFDAPALVACANDAAMVEVLLQFGADPNLKSRWWAGGFHPLHVATGEAAARLRAAGSIPDACAAAHLDDHALLASLLAEQPSRVSERGGDGQTPLHFARSRAVVDLLLDAGADLDARDVDHRATPAQWMLDRARGAGRWDLARYLVERGAQCDIFLAAALDRPAQARQLLRDDPGLLEARTSRGLYAPVPPSSDHIYTWTIGSHRSPLDVAAQFESAETLEVMLAAASPRQRLLFACRRGDAEMARATASAHPDVIGSFTADEHRAITDAAWEGEAAAVTLMLALGFDPATAGQDGGNALHCAAWRGSAATVAALLAHTTSAPALLISRDARHQATPLGWCCHGSLHGPRGGDHVAVARLLLAAGALPEPLDASDAVEELLAGTG